ncbi:succinate dehydrogenase iron-sulfur subunit [Stieleria maiorica]|uniref:Succinate dehydrogenase iron-sulfur subunit n=2 Tax=Stieleria maiorica TaxID=2795974 RepID=A0A5B9MAQ6_9BACT|nr:succinate dehydrogenase iron-sulfur subunit [Stieleria maiorica]
MLIYGCVRQACSLLVDRLLDEERSAIELRPMSKFPVIRHLFVDRHRLLRALEKRECWIPVDGYADMGPGPRQSAAQQEKNYPLSQCMSRGCCLEACAQYQLVTVT